MRGASLSFLLLWLQYASAQKLPLKITDVFATPDLSSFDVMFDRAVATSGSNLDKQNITVDPPSILITGISPVLGNPKRLRVAINERIRAGTEVHVAFTQVQSGDGQTFENVSGAGIVQSFDTIKAAFVKMQQVQKTSDEKPILASGFVTGAATGTQSGVDISVNPEIGVPGMTAFLQIKKSTLALADPKNFEVGTRFRSVFPSSRAMFAEIAGVQSDPEKIRQIIAAHEQNEWNRLIAGLLFDLTGELEGEATAFQVSNFLGDASFQWRSKTKKFIGDHGYWRGYLMPVAFEGGKNVGSAGLPNAGTRVDWLARYRGELGLTVYYENWNSEFPIRRMDLDAIGTFRQLFFDEYAYNSQSNIADRIGKGGRGYGEFDIKLFLAQTAQIRYGVRLSYTRGSLPPVYAKVKSFQFGFVWESNDTAVVKR